MKKLTNIILGLSLLTGTVYAANDSDKIGEGMIMEIHKKNYAQYKKNKDSKTVSLTKHANNSVHSDNTKHTNNSVYSDRVYNFLYPSKNPGDHADM